MKRFVQKRMPRSGLTHGLGVMLVIALLTGCDAHGEAESASAPPPPEVDVATVLVAYGDELDQVQPRIDREVEDCEDLWLAYSALPGSRSGNSVSGCTAETAVSPSRVSQARAASGRSRESRGERAFIRGSP